MLLKAWTKLLMLHAMLLVLHAARSAAVQEEPGVIRYIENHPGLFYEAFGMMRFVEKKWQIIVTLDHPTLQDQLTSGTMAEYKSTWDNCLKIFGKSCERYLRKKEYGALVSRGKSMNRHLFSIVRSSKKNDNRRSKREGSWLPGVGSFFKKAFGVMDHDDYEHIKKEIDKLYNSPRKITYLVNNATHLIRSELSNMKQNMEVSRQNIEILKNAIEDIQTEQKQQAQAITLLEYRLNFQTIGDEFIRSLRLFLDTIEELLDATDEAKHGELSQIFLSPTQLQETADQIRQLHPELEFPIPTDKPDYGALSKISAIDIANFDEKLWIVISLPLLGLAARPIYHLLPCARLQATSNGRMKAWIQPKAPYLLVAEHLAYYAFLKEQQLNDCARFDDEVLCLPNFAISSSLVKPACEIDLLLNPTQDTIKTCDIRVSSAAGTDWTYLKASNQWLFTTTETEIGQLYCRGQLQSEVKIEGTGVLSLQPDCYLQTSMDRIKHTGVLGKAEAAIQLPSINLDIREIMASMKYKITEQDTSKTIELIPMPEIMKDNKTEMTLDEIERELEEIGRQKQEIWEHPSFAFGMFGGFGGILIIGLVSCLCYKSGVFSCIFGLIKCCCHLTPNMKEEKKSPPNLCIPVPVYSDGHQYVVVDEQAISTVPEKK